MFYYNPGREFEFQSVRLQRRIDLQVTVSDHTVIARGLRNLFLQRVRIATGRDPQLPLLYIVARLGRLWLPLKSNSLNTLPPFGRFWGKNLHTVFSSKCSAGSAEPDHQELVQLLALVA